MSALQALALYADDVGKVYRLRVVMTEVISGLPLHQPPCSLSVLLAHLESY